MAVKNDLLFDSINYLEETNHYIVTINGNTGVMTTDLTVVIPLEYDMIQFLPEFNKYIASRNTIIVNDDFIYNVDGTKIYEQDIRLVDIFKTSVVQ